MNIICLKPYEDRDWEMLASWWVGAGYDAVPADLLKNCTYIGYINDLPVMSITMYLTDSPMAYLENFIANPEAPQEARKTMVKWGLDRLEQMAKTEGKKYFWAHPNNPALARYYERQIGFKTMQTGLTSMARTI